MKKIVLAIAALGALATGSAFAQGYVGAGIGQARINVDCNGTVGCDRTDTAWKLFGGFRFMPNVAGEVTWFDYGKARAGVPLGGVVFDTRVEGEGLGVGVALMGDFMPQWSGVARLGAAYNRSKVNVIGVGSDTERKFQPYFGLGVGYAINQQLKIDLAADFTRLKFEGGDKANVRMFTIGATYGF
ncbi:MAG TPA: outer membrane beta-barrel protein [Albitalea sp.]